MMITADEQVQPLTATVGLPGIPIQIVVAMGAIDLVPVRVRVPLAIRFTALAPLLEHRVGTVLPPVVEAQSVSVVLLAMHAVLLELGVLGEAALGEVLPDHHTTVAMHHP